jgi:hypothetical protein
MKARKGKGKEKQPPPQESLCIIPGHLIKAAVTFHGLSSGNVGSFPSCAPLHPAIFLEIWGRSEIAGELDWVLNRLSAGSYEAPNYDKDIGANEPH